jgi:nitric oxide reductase subunit B
MGRTKNAVYFLTLALLSLFISGLVGVLSSLQYLLPDLFKDSFHFAKLRPIHVVSSVSWIVLAATGSVYFFLSTHKKTTLFAKKLVAIHFYLFLVVGLAIYLSIILEKIGGREFFVFAPILIFPILIGWMLFAINYFKSVSQKIVNWPVYYWMWGTGIVFMIFHLSEAHLWLIPSFRENYIQDLVIQWKSVGSFVGSWNQLVYGISIYLMTKIKGDKKIARGKLVFFFYFLGLANLMFGWAHHTYIIPTQPWIRIVAYAISMTEWVILFHIIYNFIKSLPREKRDNNSLAYRFLVAADIWIFLNLFLALLMSIPAINYYTHGTHITVSHTMGTMIGINTMILLSAIWYIISKLKKNTISSKWVVYGYHLINISLFFFLLSFIIAGIRRSNWMYQNKNESFGMMQTGLHDVYLGMIISGLGVFIGLSVIIYIAIKDLRNI